MSNGSTIRLSGDPFPEHLVERGPRRTYLERDSTYLATSAPSLDVDSWTDHLPDFLKKAYNESITGLAHTVMKGEKPFDLSRYDPNILEDIAAQIFSFVMPLDFATLGVGAKVGTTFAKPVVKKLMAAKVSPRVAERAAKFEQLKLRLKLLIAVLKMQQC